MTLTQGDLWFWGFAIVISILIAYFLPFLMALWIKPTMVLWGFLVGRRRRNGILSPQFPEGSNLPNGATEEHAADEKRRSIEGNILASDALKQEHQYLEQMHHARLDHLNSKLENFEQRLGVLNNNYQQRKGTARNHFPGNVYHASLSFLNRRTAKDFLLLLIIAAVFAADMLIAQQVFTSLGLFPTDKYTLFGKEIPLTLVLGIFLTAVAALFLHIVWDRKNLRTLKERKSGFVVGCVMLALLAILRLISVISPPNARPVVEGLLLLGWMLGVIVFYWLLGEILGEQPSWFELFIAMALPALLVCVMFFGVLFILEKLVESLLKLTIQGWINLGQARTVKRRDNAEESTQATMRGFYRGLTF